jgi:hypothetical protein
MINNIFFEPLIKIMKKIDLTDLKKYSYGTLCLGNKQRAFIFYYLFVIVFEFSANFQRKFIYQ